MLDAKVIRGRIEGALADAEVHVEDTTGTGDHFAARVIADAFAGRSPVDRHRMVYAPLGDLLATGELHALQLETYTPEQWATVAAPLNE
jgi:acid stress-induced BolA-like protein IbaG/YrbA